VLREELELLVQELTRNLPIRPQSLATAAKDAI